MPELLVVDDDTSNLHSLKRLCDQIAPQWTVELLDDPRHFLAYIQDRGKSGLPDVLIVQKHYTGSSGEQLLQLALRHCPATLRCLQCNDSQPDLGAQARDLCHFNLSKPCSRSQITEVVVCRERLERLGLSSPIRDALGRLKGLPAMSPFIRDLQRLLDDSECELKDVVDLVEQDPLLVGKVLQLANSAYLGFSKPAPSVHQALARLGLNLLRAVLINDELTRYFSTSIDTDKLNEIAGRAFNIASRARQLSELAGDKRTHQEGLFIVVLLASLGDMAVLFYRNQFADLIPADMLCAYILTLWGTSAQTCQAIMLPGHPNECQGRLQFMHYLARFCDKALETELLKELEVVLAQFELSDAYRIWRE